MTAGNELSRRSFLSRGAAVGGFAALGAGASTVLAGCSSGSSGSSGSSSTVPPTNPQAGIGKGTPRKGGALTVGTMAEIDGFYPPSNHWDTNGFLYANTVFDPLMAIGTDNTIQPYLAESMTANSAYDTWTMKLRSNVTFHDGSPLTSSVVKSNLAALATSPLTKVPLEDIASVGTPDPLTVVFQLVGPRPEFPAGLTSQIGYVVSQSMIDDVNAGKTPNPIGTGPFVFSQWQPNDHFTATRNPHYWQSGVPYLDQITFKPIPDDTQRAATLKTGGVDLMLTSDPDSMSEFATNPQYQMVDSLTKVIGEPTVSFLMLNTVTPPTDDLTVRQALAKGFDAKQVLKIFGGNYARQVTGLFLPGSPYYSKTTYPAYDPDGAKQLVKQYQAQHGKPTIELQTIPDPRILQVVQVVQQMWSQVGVTVTIKSIEQATLIDNFITGSFQAATVYQFGTVDPSQNYVWFSTTTVAPLGQIGLNFPRNKDPQIEAAMQTGRSTTDAATRVSSWQTVNERLAVDLPYLWIEQWPFALVGQDRVQNFAGLTLPSGRSGQGFVEGVFFPSQVWLT